MIVRERERKREKERERERKREKERERERKRERKREKEREREETSTTCRSISGFALPSAIHNNQSLLYCRFPIFETSATALCGTTGNYRNIIWHILTVSKPYTLKPRFCSVGTWEAHNAMGRMTVDLPRERNAVAFGTGHVGQLVKHLIQLQCSPRSNHATQDQYREQHEYIVNGAEGWQSANSVEKVRGVTPKDFH